MAKYEYKCPECGKVLERDFPMGKQPRKIESYCEETGKNVEAERTWSPVPFKFK